MVESSGRWPASNSSDPRYQNYLQQSKSTQALVYQELNASGWEETHNKNGVTTHKKPHQDWVAFRVRTTFNGKTIDDLLPWLLNSANIKQWRENLNDIKTVEEYGPDMSVVQETVKKQMVVGPREFLCAQHKSEPTPGKVCITMFDVAHPGFENPPPDHTRGSCYWKQIELTQDASGTAMLFSGCTHPRGSIGTSMAGKSIGKVTDAVILLRKKLNV